MWALLVLAAIVLLFRRQILSRPRNVIGLIAGLGVGWILLEIFKADSGWESEPHRGWLVGVLLIIGVAMAAGIFRELFDQFWPSDRSRHSHDPSV